MKNSKRRELIIQARQMLKNPIKRLLTYRTRRRIDKFLVLTRLAYFSKDEQTYVNGLTQCPDAESRVYFTVMVIQRNPQIQQTKAFAQFATKHVDLFW